MQALIFRFLSWSFIRAINNKYKEYLELEEIEKLEKKIMILEVELKRKIVDLEINKMFAPEEELVENRNKSR